MKISKRDALLWMSFFAELPDDEPLLPRQQELALAAISQIEAAEDPAATMANFRACIARINSPEHYAEYTNSGFFTILREDTAADTREETLAALMRHFGLESSA